jgi:hypothetical protein
LFNKNKSIQQLSHGQSAAATAAAQAQTGISLDVSFKPNQNGTGKKKFGFDRLISFFKTSAANLITEQTNSIHSNESLYGFGGGGGGGRSESPTQLSVSGSQKSAETSLNSLDLNELSFRSTYSGNVLLDSKQQQQQSDINPMIRDAQSPRLEIDLNEITLK